VAVAPVAALCALAPPAAAQSAGSGDPYKVVVVTAPSPYWGYTYNPYASYLHGAADLVRAQGDYRIKIQQASQLREKVRQEKLVTRRKRIEHWQWELEFLTRSSNRQRALVLQEEVERCRAYATPSEIILAGPLNILFDELKGRPELPAAGSTPVNAQWLAHVHVTVYGRGNLGLLKGDRIFWPQALHRPDFKEQREQIDQLLTRAKEQVLAGQSHPRIDPELLRELRRLVDACRERVNNLERSGVDDPTWKPPGDYIEAMRTLQQVSDAIFALKKPNAADYLIPLQGNTVAELVAHMKDKGIRFAPATEGCAPAYIALHGALAAEVTRLKGQQPSANKP
jgi:hypothetical protein